MFVTNSSQSSSVDSSLDQLIDNNNDDEEQLVNLNSSDSSNSNNQNNRLNMLISYGKELLCILAFILTTFASVQNNSPKISRAVAPVPFFSKGSFVEDYYTGQLSATQTKVSLSELSFVLYYAPWCSESQHSRQSYEHVAKLFYQEAYFTAINCWQPGSECRNQYTKIHSWPILMAYQRNGFGVQYQKNLWTEGALTKFITSLLNPVQRLTTPDELLELMATKDAVVVAFLNLQDHPRNYKSFHRAAYKFLEKDAFNEIGYAVVTGESSYNFGVEELPSIRAYMWNETLEYNGNNSWTSKEINKWVFEHIQQVSFQLSPPGTKSSSLSPYLRQGPLLILFTPRNFYTEMSDPYVMLQQIGMEYYNCDEDNWINEMTRDYLFERRKENRDNYKKLIEGCQRFSHHNFHPEENNKKCDASISVSLANVLNSSKNFEARFKNVPNFCEINKLMKDKSCGCVKEFHCEKQSLKYSLKDVHITGDDKVKKTFETSMLSHDGDDRSPDSIIQYNFRRKCEILRLAKRKSDILFIDDVDPAPLELVSGLACKYNKTFTLISMDSLSFHTFAERIGIDILEIENKTAAIIMDHENESTFMLDEPVNLNSLSRFIYTYHRGGLKRFLRTNSVQYKHTHFFDINEFLNVKKKEQMEDRDIVGKKKCEMDVGKRKVHHAVIREINSEDFEEAVSRSNHTSVVLFYSANCAFCSMMSHSLLTVSRIIEEIPNIDFLRIDGDKNDLAWHFTMSEYPTLIIFPAGDKSESRRFPVRMSINTSNVLGFLLANLNRSQRLLGLVMACNYKRHNSTYDCITTIQEEITDSISFCLREWRKNPLKRTAILRIIKQLKEIYLNLFLIRSSCDFLKIEVEVKSLMEKWKKIM
ncbi:CLUMA_CG007951, isoform A [Clunio marinus]|uniref:CLUMA_CG007951, isoform A n=1 Tax=Clunio marinus TaxID=568069 RepID=A0A1J1I4D4_9DIPT|nr:CLUMA_CG007951, isoform A [Clunio marinus]